MSNKKLVKAVFDNVLQKSGEARVTKIHFAVGEMSEPGVEEIEQQWNELTNGTRLEQAQLHFRLITAEVQCMACFKKYHPVNGVIHCPICGSFGAKILSGEEFYVERIETLEE